MAASPAVRRLPYLTFGGLLVFTVLFTVLSLVDEARSNARQDQQIDPATGTWNPSYDWQAENGKLELITKLRVGLLWALAAHGVVNAVYAPVVTRGWRGLLLGLAFLGLSVLLALVLVAGSVGGPAMIGGLLGPSAPSGAGSPLLTARREDRIPSAAGDFHLLCRTWQHGQ